MNTTSIFWKEVGDALGSFILVIFCIFIAFSILFVGFLVLCKFYYSWGCDEYCRERNRNRNRNRNSYEIVNDV